MEGIRYHHLYHKSILIKYVITRQYVSLIQCNTEHVKSAEPSQVPRANFHLPKGE